jgi:hypothetical protein
MSNIEKPLELSEFTVSDTVPLLLLPLDKSPRIQFAKEKSVKK